MTFAATSSPWIRKFRTTTASREEFTAVCLPHAGGSASFYHDLAVLLDPSATVVAAQYPGRQDRLSEPPFLTIEEAAHTIAAGLQPWTGGPIVLFGHSMGALIAFEVGRWLEANQGRRVDAIVVSGCRGPSMDRDKKYEAMDDAAVVEELKEQGGTDAELFEHPELVAMMLPAIRADYLAVERYQASGEAVVNSPVIALWGTEDPDCAADDIEAWRTHTTDGFEVHAFPGGHFFLVDHWAQTQALISSRLPAS